MNFGKARMRLGKTGVAIAVAALVAGCGNNYRSTVTTTTPSGPAAQTTAYAVVVSAPSSATTSCPTTKAGIVTIIDYSGDTWMAQACTTGPDPVSFTLDTTGGSGYTNNSDSTISNFPVSKSLQQKQVYPTTFPSTAQPMNIYATSSGLWVADLDKNVADAFSGSPQTLQRTVSLAPTPVLVMGSTSRSYGISQGEGILTGVECNISPSTVAANGEADVIESSYTVSAKIPLGKCPVYAVESSDASRLFVLNRGSDTITVINMTDGALNSCTPFVDHNTGRTVTCHSTLPLSQAALNTTNAPANCNYASDPTCSLAADGGLAATAGPVYAEYNTAKSLLVVANYDGGTISVIDVSLDRWGNDSAAFGTTYTIPVGTNPASVTVLLDGSRAYTANQADDGTGNGTVTVVALSSNTVEKTLPVTGHPRNVASIQNSEYGKVYVASPDSNLLTVINAGGAEADTLDTTVPVVGNIVDVRVNTQDGTAVNSNNLSRTPGYGQPCNLPLSEYNPASSSDSVALANCKVQDVKNLK
jgi:hypothetical protein